MTLLEELAQADVPGAKIRLALMRRGAKAEQERIIKLLGTIVVDREGFLNYNEAVALIKGEGESK